MDVIVEVSIIIVTYNSSHIIHNCIQYISKLNRCEIIFIDNNSDDHTPDLIENAGYKVVKQATNIGFANAANKGAILAHGDLLCFLNPDCEITQDVCDMAISGLENNLVNCAVPNYFDGKKVICGRQPGYTSIKIIADMFENHPYMHYGSNILKLLPFYNDYSWYWPIAACLFIPRQTFFLINCFSEKYFMYLEDVELGFNLSSMGGNIITINKSVKHIGGMSSSISNYERIRHLNKSRIVFAQNYYNKTSQLAVNLINKLF